MELESYLEEQLAELQREAGREDLTSEDEKRIEAEFIQNYFLVPLQKYYVPYEIFLKMQKVIKGIFPYWFDNDLLFSKGRAVLERLSLIGTNFCNEMEYLKRFRPYISVIMPTYNRGGLIEQSIKSVLEQSYRELELIVVDDASTDDTEQVVKGMDDPRVRYFRNEVNRGTSAAKNRGIQEAKYDYISFQDDDDLCRKDKLEKQMRLLMNTGKYTGFCYCEMAFHRLDGTELKMPLEGMPEIRKSGYIYPELLRRNFIGGPTMLIRKECLDAVGLFREDMMVYEDWELALRLSKRYDVAFAGGPLYDYYEHKNSLTTTKEESYLKSVYENIDPFLKWLFEERNKYGLDEKQNV